MRLEIDWEKAFDRVYQEEMARIPTHCYGRRPVMWLTRWHQYISCPVCRRKVRAFTWKRAKRKWEELCHTSSSSAGTAARR